LADAVLTGPGLIGTAAKPTRVLWTADAAGVVTRWRSATGTLITGTREFAVFDGGERARPV